MAVQAPATILFSLFYVVFCTGKIEYVTYLEMKIIQSQVFFVNSGNFVEQVLVQRHFYLLETG